MRAVVVTEARLKDLEELKETLKNPLSQQGIKELENMVHLPYF